jgi:hypothetical protein
MGALITALGRSKLDQALPQVPAEQRHRLAESLGAGGAHIPGPVGRAVQEAFVSALNSGLRLGAAIALLGAGLAWVLIDVKRPSAAGAEPAAEGAVAGPAGEPERAAA